MELLQELFLTAFLALVFSLLVAKLVNGGVHVTSGEKGDSEIGKLDRGLKVVGSKSKKRVRFADQEQVVEKVHRFSGEQETSGGELTSCEIVGGNLETCLEETVNCGNIATEDLGHLIVDKIETEVGNNDDDVVGGQSGEVVRVLEERSGIEGNVVITALDELNVIEKNGSDVAGDEQSVRFDDKDDVIGGDRSGEDVMVLEELVEEERNVSDVNYGNLRNTDLDELIVEEKNENEEADDNESVGLAAHGDVIGDQSGELRVVEESVVEERSMVIDTLDEKNENDEADNEKSVGLLLGMDSVTEERIASSVKERNELKSGFNELIVNKTSENENEDNETSVKVVTEGIVGEQSEEVRVVDVGEDHGTGIGDKLDKGDTDGEGLVSNEDDDWEGIERSDLEKIFATAVSYVDYGGKNDRSLNLGNDVPMQLYGLHKVAMEGPCYEAQPMALRVSARAKWNAWQRLGNMTPEVAMEQYVSLLSDKDPGWMQGQGNSAQVDSKPDSSEFANAGLPESNTSTMLDKQTNSVEMNLELEFNKDGIDLTGSSN